MKRKLWHHICVLVILTVLISFAAAGIVIYRHVWKETGITLEGAGGFLTVIWDSVGWILGVLAVVLVLSVFFVNLQVKRLIEPINENMRNSARFLCGWMSRIGRSGIR